MDNRIICAANYYPEINITILGVRHFCSMMVKQIEQLSQYNFTQLDCIQGFMDKNGNFHTRQSAWVIADEAGQIIRRVGGDNQKLFSENLY
jgi:hypothetical protein